MKKFLVTIALMGPMISWAQYMPVGAITMWTDGYVVTMQNDTVRGQVRIGSLVNDSPASILVRTADNSKRKWKGDDLRMIAQRLPDFAYATGSIPRDREMVVFERVPSPRQKNKPVLLERLTPAGGALALYFNASGRKKTTEYTFGNFVLERQHQDFSYVVLKNGHEALLAKRSELENVYERLFGDCSTFLSQYPTASRRDWNRFGEMVAAYNQLCSDADQ